MARGSRIRERGREERMKGRGKRGIHTHIIQLAQTKAHLILFIIAGMCARECVRVCVCESTSVNHVVSVCKLSFEWTLMSTCLCTDAERYPSDTFTPKGNDLMRSYVIA